MGIAVAHRRAPSAASASPKNLADACPIRASTPSTQRLTEPNLDIWRRFRGRLSPNDLIALRFEDAAVLHTIPFDAAAIGLPARLDRLPEPTAEAWVRAAAALNLTATGADYVAEQARALGVPSRLSRSERCSSSRSRPTATGGQDAQHRERSGRRGATEGPLAVTGRPQAAPEAGRRSRSAQRVRQISGRSSMVCKNETTGCIAGD
jgi:hypothetical protein